MGDIRWAVKKVRRHALTLGGFALSILGHLFRDSDGDFVRVPADLRDQVEAFKFENI